MILSFVILLLCFIVFYGPIKQAVRGAFSGSTRSARAFLSQSSMNLRHSFDFIFKIKDLRSENEELSRKLLQLEVDHSYTSELEIENAMLKKELGFLSEAEKGSLVPARIIQRDPIAFLDYIVIDKGEKDGVALKAAVVYNNVLVGQVSEVFGTSARVTLITSKDSMVQAMLQNSRSNGLLKGGISGLYLDNIVLDTEYMSGENIITSGLGGTMKQGILVGTAGKVQSYSSGIFKSIEVQPLVDLSKLEMVFVEK